MSLLIPPSDASFCSVNRYYRLYLLPVLVLYNACYKGVTCAHALYIHQGILDDAWPYIMSHGSCWSGKESEIRVASEQVVAAAVARGEAPPHFNVLLIAVVASSLIGALILMHLYWYSIFIRILAKIVNGTKGHKASEQEYDGVDKNSKLKTK